MIIWAILAIIIAIILGAYLGFVCANKFFTRTIYTPKNAIKLLKMGRSEEWNEVRIKNPEWYPIITDYDLSDISLPSTDFRRATLENVNFTKSNLEGCKFNEATIINTNFSSSILTDVSFNEANIKNTIFMDATFLRTTFENAKLESVELPFIDTNLEKEPKRLNDLYHFFIEIVKNPSLIDNISPNDFKEIVAGLFIAMGYKVTLSPVVQDGGYDMLLIKDDPVSDIKAIVEVKKYSPNQKIGLSTVRKITSIAMSSNVNKAILVTLCDLSKQAIEFAEKIPILQLIDREQFIELLSKYGLKDYKNNAKSNNLLNMNYEHIKEKKEKYFATPQQLQKIESIGNLAGEIAMEFNNILNVIMGRTEIALTDLPINNPLHQNLKEILKASERAKVLDKRLLSFVEQVWQIPEAETEFIKGTERVLIVDDNEMIIHLTQTLMQKVGYQVTAKTSITDAIEVFRKNPDAFDVVIVNQYMPIMAGDQLINELKKFRPDVKGILIGVSEKFNETQKIGTDIIAIAKDPFVVQEITHAIRKIFDKKSGN
jgi:CheY-like chemotaxis protein/HJR/Mrr/RecB family endonuclease